MTYDDFIERLDLVHQSGAVVSARCPAHEDRNPSLSVGEGDDGRIIVKCHAGCSASKIVKAMGLGLRDLFPDTKTSQTEAPEAAYEYTDAEGKNLFDVVRFPGKRFRQRRPDPDNPGNYLWNRDGVEPVLYRLPKALSAVAAGQTIYVVEGEKDVAALEGLGAVATCNPGGAGKWRSEYSEALRGATVVVVADRDEPGRRHAAQVAEMLKGIAASVEVVEPAEGKDAADHITGGLRVADFCSAQAEAMSQLGSLLDAIVVFIRRFVIVSDAQSYAIALWLAHTHAFAAADISPYLEVSSAEKESGKTRVLELLALLAARPWFTSGVSVSVIARKVDAEQPTLLLDETDALFGGDKEHTQGLRGILNTGFQRGGTHTINVPAGPNGWQPMDFSVFSPKAFAGIGSLPDTIVSRSIPIRLQRRRPEETVEKFRQRTAPGLAAPLRQQLEHTLPACIGTLRDITEANPEMPPSLSDRTEDVWEPLIAIADLAGGHWPRRAREAAVELSTSRARSEASIRVRLLGDIRSIFDAQACEFIGSAALVAALTAIEESPWGGWGHGRGLTTHALANQLAEFDIAPRRDRTGSTRGYFRDQFADAFARYASPPAAQTVKPSDTSRAWSTAANGLTAQPDALTVQGLTTEPPGDFESAAEAQPSDISDEQAEIDALYDRLAARHPDIAHP